MLEEQRRAYAPSRARNQRAGRLGAFALLPAARRVAAVVRRVILAEGARRTLAAATFAGFFAAAGVLVFADRVVAALFADLAVDVDRAAGFVAARVVLRAAGFFVAAGLGAPFAGLFIVAGFAAAFALAGLRAVVLATVLVADFVVAAAAFLLLFALLAMTFLLHAGAGRRATEITTLACRTRMTASLIARMRDTVKKGRR